jgi:hypothetical protein
MQAGQPYARTINAGAANGINYGTQRILAEPIGSRQQDNIVLLDARVEKVIKIGGGRSVSIFGDGFNLTNANPASNITWSSGSTFLLPVTIVSPRLARIGAKLDW